MFQEFKLRHFRTVTACVVFFKESSVHEPVGEIRAIHPMSWPDENLSELADSILKSGGRAQIC